MQHWIPEQRTREKNHDRGFCARTGQLAKVTEELEYKKQPKKKSKKDRKRNYSKILDMYFCLIV